MISIKDPEFGAKGDGITNDRPAIQAAIDQLTSMGGGTLLIPSGTYGVSSPILMNSNIKVAGEGVSSVIKALYNFSGVPILNIYGSDCSIQDIKIDLSQGGTVSVNLSGGAKNVMLKRILFYKGAQKIYMNNTTGTVENVSVIYCDFDNGGEATGFGILLNSSARGKSMIIQGCRFYGDASDYIEINRADFYDVSIVGNQFMDLTNNAPTSGFAIGIAKGNNITISENTFYRIFKKSVHIENNSSSINISNNTFRECGKNDNATVENQVIDCINASDQITISGNIFHNSARTGDAIYLAASGGSNGKNYVVTGNAIKGFNRAIVNSEQPYCTFVGNTIMDCSVAFHSFKATQQTYSNNVITSCDTGFNHVGWNNVYSSVDAKQSYISNCIGADVINPFQIDERAPFMIARSLIGNINMPNRVLNDSDASNLVSLRTDFNKLLGLLRASNILD